MKLRNKTNETVKRSVNGSWHVVKPGDVIDMDPNEAVYLLTVERHYWEDADILRPAPEPEPAPEPQAKPKPVKKGGE
jgi:hypothetical protein